MAGRRMRPKASVPVDVADREALLRALVERRESLDMSQQDVARLMGTTQSHVSGLERGTADARFSTLQRFARTVGCRIHLSLCEDGEDPA